MIEKTFQSAGTGGEPFGIMKNPLPRAWSGGG